MNVFVVMRGQAGEDGCYFEHPSSIWSERGLAEREAGSLLFSAEANDLYRHGDRPNYSVEEVTLNEPGGAV